MSQSPQKFLSNIFAPENVPVIVLLSGSILIIGLIMGVAMMKSIDEEDDDDCFSEEQTAKIQKHNEQIKEGFQTLEEENLEEEELEEEKLSEKPDWNPDILIVLRTDYNTAVRLSQQGLVEEYIGTYPTLYAIKKLNTNCYQRRKSI